MKVAPYSFSESIPATKGRVFEPFWYENGYIDFAH